LNVANWFLVGLLLFYPIAAFVFPDFPKRGRYFVFNAGLTLYFVAVVIGYLVADFRKNKPQHGFDRPSVIPRSAATRDRDA